VARRGRAAATDTTTAAAPTVAEDTAADVGGNRHVARTGNGDDCERDRTAGKQLRLPKDGPYASDNFFVLFFSFRMYYITQSERSGVI